MGLSPLKPEPSGAGALLRSCLLSRAVPSSGAPTGGLSRSLAQADWNEASPQAPSEPTRSAQGSPPPPEKKPGHSPGIQGSFPGGAELCPLLSAPRAGQAAGQPLEPLAFGARSGWAAGRGASLAWACNAAAVAAGLRGGRRFRPRGRAAATDGLRAAPGGWAGDSCREAQGSSRGPPRRRTRPARPPVASGF